MKSLEKALDILNFFTIERAEAGITEISEHFGLCKSNVYDIIKTFERRGYIEQNPQTMKYRLGYQIVKRSFVLNNTRTKHSIVLPKLQSLSNVVNEKVYYGTIDEDMVIYLEQAAPQSYYYIFDVISGNTAPLHCTGIGKALLAFRGDSFVDHIIECGLQRYTANTITDGDAFWKEIREIRARGYSIDNMEHEFGVKCIGMPVLDVNGHSAAAVSITGPSLRFTDDKIPSFVEAIQGCINDMKHQLFL